MKRCVIALVLSAAMITLTSCSDSETSVQSPSADTETSHQTNDAENSDNSDLSNIQTAENVELDLNAGNSGNTITEEAETAETGEPEQTAEAAKSDGYPPKIYHNGKLYSSMYFFDWVGSTEVGTMSRSFSDIDVYLNPGGIPTLFDDLGDLTYHKKKIGRTVPIGFDETPDEELECNQGADEWADVYTMDVAGYDCLLVIFNPVPTGDTYGRFIDVYAPDSLDYEDNRAITDELCNRYQEYDLYDLYCIVRPDGRKWVYYKGRHPLDHEIPGDWVFVTVEAGTAEE